MGVSGSTEGVDRLAFQEMLTALLSNGTRMVLIERLDRIARDIVVQESILKELNRKGFELISVSEPDLCSADPYRSAMRQMLGVFAELDRKTIVIKLRAARQRKKQQTGRCQKAASRSASAMVSNRSSLAYEVSESRRSELGSHLEHAQR